MESLKQAIEKIEQFRKELEQVLNDQQAFAMRASGVLTSLENGFRGACGLPIVTQGQTAQAESTFNPQPLTNLFGMDLTNKAKPITVETTAPAKSDVDKLREEVTAAAATFTERNPKDILDNMEHMIIRGVARKYGMTDVTSSNPEKLDIKFIESVQAKIKAANEVQPK